MTTTVASESTPSDPDGGEGEVPARPPRVVAPTGWTLVALIVALCFLAGAVGWTVGRGRPPAEGSADVGFLRDMRTHHENAVTLSQIELANGRDPAVKVFADEIMRFQSYEIGLMDRMVIEWGYRPEDRPPGAMGWMGHEVPATDMPGMATAAELTRLRTAEAETDAVFVALMIDHHAAGAEMAEAAAAAVDDADVRDLARRMARNQRAEIPEMTAAAGRSGLDPAPEGVDFDVHGVAGSASEHEMEHD